MSGLVKKITPDMIRSISIFLLQVFILFPLWAQSEKESAIPEPAELQEKGGKPSIADPGKVYEYKEVQTPPVYPGGVQEMDKFLKEAVSCPSEVWQENVNGYVVVRVIIHEDGALSDAEIVREFREACREEALRAVEKLAESANWDPGLYMGQPVKVYYQIRIPFYCAHY
ncbi:MAG TPA: energy transducer TonB [Saprospiraceae bacterium]|nr:energy transducer TonB [Saprospiraceae bacterium]HPI06853.1 energy transducer TonB [Saprospiraceae bacterium]